MENKELIEAGPWLFATVFIILVLLRIRLRSRQGQRSARLTRGRIAPGVYEHFKGKRYEVVCVAYHSETKEDLVVYQAMYEKGDAWVRPLAEFLEEVEVSGKKVPRFRYLGYSKNPPK